MPQQSKFNRVFHELLNKRDIEIEENEILNIFLHFWKGIEKLNFISLDHQKILVNYNQLVKKLSVDQYDAFKTLQIILICLNIYNPKILDIFWFYENIFQIKLNSLTDSKKFCFEFFKKIPTTLTLEAYVYVLSTRDDKSYKTWKQNLMITNAHVKIFQELLFLLSKNLSKIYDEDEIFLHACLCLFSWEFSDSLETNQIFLIIKDVLSIHRKAAINDFLRGFHDFWLQKISIVSNQAEFVGFSCPSHNLYISILFDITDRIKDDIENVIRTIEQIFSVCLIDSRVDFQCNYLSHLPNFIKLLEKYSCLFNTKLAQYICFCLTVKQSKDKIDFLKYIFTSFNFILTTSIQESILKVLMKIFIKIIDEYRLILKSDTDLFNQFMVSWSYFSKNHEFSEFLEKVIIQDPTFPIYSFM